MVLHIKSIGLQWSNQTILVNLKSMWSESYRLMVENVESTTVQKYGMDQSQTRRLHLLPFVLVRVWVKGWKLLGPQWIVWTGGKKKMLKLSTFDRCRYRLGYGTEAETVSRERESRRRVGSKWRAPSVLLYLSVSTSSHQNTLTCQYPTMCTRTAKTWNSNRLINGVQVQARFGLNLTIFSSTSIEPNFDCKESTRAL